MRFSIRYVKLISKLFNNTCSIYSVLNTIESTHISNYNHETEKR